MVAKSFERAATEDARVRALYRDLMRDEVLVPLGLAVDEESLAAEAPPADLLPPGGDLLLVALDGEPVAIGGVRDLEMPVPEVKSMYVAPAARGRGLGRRLLGRLERIAAAHGCRAVRLDTAFHMTTAISLYRDLGYREIPAYNEGPNADLWFERTLSSWQVVDPTPGAGRGTGSRRPTRRPAGPDSGEGRHPGSWRPGSRPRG